MAKPVLLLGAGASIDAGLPSAFDLTEVVYSRLINHSHAKNLFGYVVSKLVVRQARNGFSPFEKLNVEEVYASLKRFIARDSDALSEFVYSWDPVTLPSGKAFSSDEFSRILSQAITKRRGLNGDLISLDSYKLKAAGELISNALQPLGVKGDLDSALRPYLDVLVTCLTPTNEVNKYVDRLTCYCKENVAAVATLNYDTVFENSCSQQDINVDHGLSRWNKSKYIRFTGTGVKLAKLHGSINWYESHDEILIDPDSSGWNKRALIFGGQSDKLVAHGPYLQLRHEFQSLLRSTNVFGIIGYSFQDTHLNAIIRAWISSRRNAKLVILDPGVPRLGSDVLGVPYIKNKDGTVRRTVEIEHIAMTASEGMQKFLASLETAPNPPANT